ncbi:MAG: hypothetical protein HONBIEJF_01959 [Fimbriimonadaceae bacterium]|nr:hypothetical protein [Fimbriimonadaceae bacterium]
MEVAIGGEMRKDREAQGEASALLRLVEHLRDTPNAASESAAQLANRFDVPEPLVADALEVLRESRRDMEELTGAKRIPLQVRLRERVNQAAEWTHRHPLLASVLLGVFGALQVHLSDVAGWPRVVTELSQLIMGNACVLWIAYQRGQVRYSLPISTVTLMTFAAFLNGLRLIWPLNTQNSNLTPMAFLFNAASLSLFLAGLAAVAALFGALRRVKREFEDEAKLDRRDLLEQVLQLKQRLGAGRLTTLGVDRYERLKWSKQHWPIFAVALGALGGVFSIACGSWLGEPGEAVGTGVQANTIAVFWIGLATFSFLGVGFLAGGWRRALIAGSVSILVYFGLCQSAMAEGWAVFDPFATSSFASRAQIAPMIGQIFQMVLILLATMGGVGSGLIQHRLRKVMLKQEDNAAMLAEIIRLQGMLHVQKSEVVALVVDVVKSTMIKRDEDPMVVEFSFRSFHNYIARQVQRFGGRIYFTAGDAAIAEFTDANRAFQAATTIQAEIEAFNEIGNHLRSPFQTRIALHAGLLHGGLDQVHFTDVIDVAAHLEKHSPVGGVALTEPVAAQLDGVVLERLSEPVDGFAAYRFLPVRETAVKAS